MALETEKLLAWIGRSWEDVRRAADFWRIDRAEWKEHVAEADRRFSTEHLGQEISRLNERFQADEKRLHLVPLERASRSRSLLLGQIVQFQDQLALFERNFHDELQIEYQALEEVKEEISETKSRLDDAYAEQSSASSYVSHWHSRSRSSLPFYGKRGKPIPKHSLFGMSHGKRERAQSRAKTAGYEIGDLKDELGDLHGRRKAIGASIGALKSGRDERKRLKETGISPKLLRQQIADCEANLVRFAAVISKLERELAQFRSNSAIVRKIAEAKAEIASTKAARKSYLAAFHSPDEVGRRKAVHLEQWQSSASAENR